MGTKFLFLSLIWAQSGFSSPRPALCEECQRASSWQVQTKAATFPATWGYSQHTAATADNKHQTRGYRHGYIKVTCTDKARRKTISQGNFLELGKRQVGFTREEPPFPCSGRFGRGECCVRTCCFSSFTSSGSLLLRPAWSSAPRLVSLSLFQYSQMFIPRLSQ